MTIQEMAKFVLEIEENTEQADVEGFALNTTGPVVGQTQLSGLGFKTYVPKYIEPRMVCKGCHGG